MSSQIRAANGILIEAFGLAQLPILLNREEILVEGVTSDHVAEMIVSIDWLEAQAAMWDVRKCELFMHWRVFSLNAKFEGGWMCRVASRSKCSSREVRDKHRRICDVSGLLQ